MSEYSESEWNLKPFFKPKLKPKLSLLNCPPSPVWWQCLNHNPSGSDSGTADNLQSWNYGQHAAGLVEILAHAREYWNISFSSVEAFNEPMSSWWTATGTACLSYG